MVDYEFVSEPERDNVYIGRRGLHDHHLVMVNGHALDPRLDVRNHSPTGFEWGYQGSGPSQLALAILIHEWGNTEVAEQWYQVFKTDIIANLPREKGFSLSSKQIDEWAEKYPKLFALHHEIRQREK
jgi:hypothetical protein